MWSFKSLGYFRIIMWHECDIYSYYCSWLFSSYFIIRIFIKWWWKAQLSKETFVSEMWLLISMKHAFSYSTEVVFINLYWKDGHSGKTIGFCKHKNSSLYNQAVEVIYSSLHSSCWSQEAAQDAWRIDTYYLNCTG